MGMPFAAINAASDVHTNSLELFLRVSYVLTHGKHPSNTALAVCLDHAHASESRLDAP